MQEESQAVGPFEPVDAMAEYCPNCPDVALKEAVILEQEIQAQVGNQEVTARLPMMPMLFCPQCNRLKERTYV
jgi:hypothetical protein